MRRLPYLATILPWFCMAAAVAAGPAIIVTDVPLDTLQRCLTAHLAETGRMIPINTAGGVMLDFAFQNVGPDGKVTTSHIAFAIEDLGTQRRVTATAPDGADAALAQQLLRDTTKGCTADAGD